MIDLRLGDCVDILPTIPPGSVDAIVTDPPYPYIKRDYGRWNETEWREMIDGVVTEARRVLKPSGSMVMVLQPNSEHIGQMRPWLWRFMADLCDSWNIVQDAYWWNYTAMPHSTGGLMRASVKYCIWIGPPDCYRNPDNVLWKPNWERVASNKAESLRNGNRLKYFPSGTNVRRGNLAEAVERKGGSTPFNLLPICNADSSQKHGAGTPLPLMHWWIRYICPQGGTVLDPFSGHGTTGDAAQRLGADYIGIERDAGYHAIAAERLNPAQMALFG